MWLENFEKLTKSLAIEGAMHWFGREVKGAALSRHLFIGRMRGGRARQASACQH